MKLIYICSPYRGDIKANMARAKRYCYFAHSVGGAPITPHFHNPMFLGEILPDERRTGIEIGFEYLQLVDELWCFGDHLTEGMERELQVAKERKLTVRFFNDRCEEVL